MYNVWPTTTIATAAAAIHIGGDMRVEHSHTPSIMADAAYAILTRTSRECTGSFLLMKKFCVQQRNEFLSLSSRSRFRF